MAGDWLKWTKGLTRKPEVVALASRLDRNRHEVAALLMEIWEWADDVTEDGHVDSVTVAFIDELIGTAGFGKSMVEVAWLVEAHDGITFPNFERHNGESAKKRAQTAERKRRQRANETSVSRNGRDKSVTRGIGNRTRDVEKNQSGRIPKADQMSEFDFDGAIARAIKAAKAIRPKSRQDRQLIARAAILAETCLSESWFNESLGAVTKCATDRPPAKFLSCCRERANKMHGTDFDAVAKSLVIPKRFYDEWDLAEIPQKPRGVS